MRRTAFNTIRVTRDLSEAEAMLGWLRQAGLHPVDLALSAPLPLSGAERSFPVQVPSEEAEAAREVLEGRHSLI